MIPSNLLAIQWAHPSNSGALFGFIGGTLLLGLLFILALTKMPPQARRPITVGFTFVSGLFYVLLWLWPAAQDKKDDELPRGAIEGVSFWLTDAVSQVANLSTILTAMLLLLGVFSLLRLNLIRIAKQQKDWAFSVVLVVSFVSIAFFGYWDWLSKLSLTPEQLEAAEKNWMISTYGRDFFFDGLLQAMDAAMFSIIAFYILSAAYRAFRVRSVEATILLASALFMMMSLLALVDLWWNNGVNVITGPDNQAHFANNFRLTEIAGFIRRSFQGPSLRAIDFGIGIGALAMGLRLWLGLEKGGVSN